MAGSLDRSFRMNSTSIRLTSLSDAESDSHRISLRIVKIPPLFPRKVPLDEATVPAPQVVDRVGQVHADEDLPVRIRDLVR